MSRRILTLNDFEPTYQEAPEVLPGLEQYNPFRFMREHNVFRLAHIGTRITKLDNTIQLGFGSLLHVLDNAGYPTLHQDTPRLEEHPLITNEGYQKWIYHVMDFDKSGPLGDWENEKYIYRPAGLMTSLMKFKSFHKNEFRYLTDLAWIQKKKESLTIVNHNALFRMYIYGRLRFYRKMELILSSVMNTVLSIRDKTQYIEIPLSSMVYAKETFLRSKIKIDLTTVKYPDDFHWIFMMQLVNFLDTKCETSMFEKIPKHRLKDINFILTEKNPDGTQSAIFYNLQDLVDLNTNNRAYVRIVNHINILATTGTMGLSAVARELPVDTSGVDDPYAKVPTVDVKSTPATDTPVITEPGPVTSGTPDDVVEKKIEEVVEKESTKRTIVSVAPSATSVITDTVAAIKANVTPTKVAPVVRVAGVAKPVVIPVVSNKNDTSVKAPVITIEPTVKSTPKYTVELKENALKFIDSQDALTPKQKERCKILAEKYKTLTLGDVSLEKLLEEGQDVSVDVNDKVGIVTDLPDKSMARSKVVNFDEVYMNKTFKSDLASVVTSFTDKGMYLTDIKETPINTELTKALEYRCSYEDHMGKKHTVKFQVPKVQDDGTCLINGSKKYLKKQMLNLPICKISESRVSLASNYNKSIVERNTAKAHSYLPFMQRVLELGVADGTLTCTFAMTTLNLPLAYEYTELATKYKSVVFKDKEHRTHTLCFDYHHRYTELVLDKDLSQVSSLEKQHGVLLGTINKLLFYFIDANNSVSLYTLNGTNVECPTSILDIIRTNYKPELADKIGMLTEWTDLKILDKQFPIAFILSYYYGFKATLNYLGVKYTVMNKRSKTVIENEDSLTVTSRLSNIKHLDSLDMLGLKPDEYVILASASAMVHGMPIINEDIDILVDKPTIDRLLSEDRIVPGIKDGIHDHNYLSKDGKIDIIYMGYTHKYDPAYFKGIHKKSEYIDGYTFLSYPALIDFYKALYAHHKQEKHKVKLDWLNANKHTVDERYQLKNNDIVIKFKDCDVVINRYPLTHSLIMAGISYFDTAKYYLEEFENKDVYYSLLIDKKYRINYLKGIEAFFELFVDPITRDVLIQMGEPTNVRDLLIRATVLLSTTDHREASAMANHRIRGYEQINAIVYNEMSRQLAAYKVRRGQGNTFSINPEAVYQKVIRNESFAIIEDINPINNLKEKTAITYAGAGGRTSESFVVNDRRYPVDGLGIISEATVDNTKVAINSYLSLDPNILNTRGLLETVPADGIESTQLLSATALLMPCSTNDDSKRLNFVSIQLAHAVPMKTGDVCRIRTGFERVLAHRSSSNFVGVARMDGVVSSVDPVAKMIRVDYKDGTTDIFTYGEEYTEISGFHITQRIAILVKQGDKVKANDIVIYNSDFFQLDPHSQQLDYYHGVDANVVLMECDGTLEDSNQITTKLGKRMGMYPTMVRTIELTSQSIVHHCVGIGTHVYNTDPLIIFEESESGDLFGQADKETQAMLSKLNRKTPHAKHSGEIVKIDVFYSCPINEMHASLRAIVNTAVKEKNARAKFVRGTPQEMKYNAAEQLPIGTKYKGVLFEKDTVVLQIYIKEDMDHGMGDKLVLGNQLKSTTMGVLADPPMTESGYEVDAIFSSDRIAARIVLSPYLVGIGARVLERLEEHVVDMYFDD